MGLKCSSVDVTTLEWALKHLKKTNQYLQETFHLELKLLCSPCCLINVDLYDVNWFTLHQLLSDLSPKT